MRNEESRETLTRFELNSERKSAHDSLLAVVSAIVFITVIFIRQRVDTRYSDLSPP